MVVWHLLLFLMHNLIASDVLPFLSADYISDQNKDSKSEGLSEAKKGASPTAGAGLPSPFDFSNMSSLLNVCFLLVPLIYLYKYGVEMLFGLCCAGFMRHTLFCAFKQFYFVFLVYI